MRYLPHKKGVILIASIMLIVFVSTAILSITIFIVENLRQSEIKAIRTRCLYLAQAGINQALYFYREGDRIGNGTFFVGRTSVGSDNFTLGGISADFLMVDVTGSSFPTVNRDILRNVRLQNVTSNRNITIQSITLSWNNANTLTSIRRGATYLWSGNVGPGVNVNLTPDVTILPDERVTLNYYFSGNMLGSTITAQYFLSDCSRRDETIYPQARIKNFTINLTGRVAGISPIYRTIRASYNSDNETPAIRRVFEYREINAPCNPATGNCCDTTKMNSCDATAGICY